MILKSSSRFKEFDLRQKYNRREKELAEGTIWNTKVKNRIEKLQKKINEKSDYKLTEEN